MLQVHDLAEDAEYDVPERQPVSEKQQYVQDDNRLGRSAKGSQ